MLRPTLLVVVAVALVAALLGVGLGRPVVAAGLAGLMGLAAAWLVAEAEERRVRRAAARVERLLDRLPLAVLLFAPSGLVHANPAARELFPAAGHGPRTPVEVLRSAALADAVAEVSDTERPLELEVEHEGRHLVARAVATARDEVALVVTDLTDTRRVEAMRRDFVTNASHELKTPVAAIQALADSLALAARRDPDRAHRMILRLEQEALRLSQLVRDLLDLTRLEEDETAAARRQRVDVAEIVRAQVEAVASLAEQRNVTIECAAPQSARLVAAASDVRLIVQNLLENAVLYNVDGGSVRVTVGRNGATVELVVEDTGIGIADADQERLFERFYRVDRARSRAAGGTGLGLSLVRHAARRHGGDVSVESVLGEGATFRVTLPVEGAGADV